MNMTSKREAKQLKRWRKWSCRYGENRKEEAEKDIRTLNRMGFRAKVWAPLPQHKTSGHVHVSVLCTQEQYLDLQNWIEFWEAQKDVKNTNPSKVNSALKYVKVTLTVPKRHYEVVKKVAKFFECSPETVFQKGLNHALKTNTLGHVVESMHGEKYRDVFNNQHNLDL